MTFTENVMRRLYEKAPELKDTTFCGRTLIAKVDSQIIEMEALEQRFLRMTDGFYGKSQTAQQ